MLVITEEVLGGLNLDAWDGENRHLALTFTKRFEAWEKTVSNAKPLSKQERWALREFMTEQKYHNWVMDLPMGPKRRKLNHPNAIINAYKRSHPNPNDIKAKREKLVEKKADIEPVIDELHDRLELMDEDGQRAVVERLVRPFGWSLNDQLAPGGELAPKDLDTLSAEIAAATAAMPAEEATDFLGELRRRVTAMAYELMSEVKVTEPKTKKTKPKKKAKAT